MHESDALPSNTMTYMAVTAENFYNSVCFDKIERKHILQGSFIMSDYTKFPANKNVVYHKVERFQRCINC